ncbi:MAG: glutamate-5-semialdehyde dehydrogenase [Kiritimatiellae bacterium]|nr:glutamate-5-semialdehyde dehydrogenase [Kiritimatiellia bacterium]
MQSPRTLALAALAASRELARLSPRRKNQALDAMADALDAHRPALRAANAADLADARAAALPDALMDRLLLSDARIDAMIHGIRALEGLPDPIGEELAHWIRPNGLVISKRRVPIGVIAIIYEARPNVTADAAALCFKSSNAVILRGGHEASRSNQAILDALRAGAASAAVPPDAFQLLSEGGHEAVNELIRLEGLVDLVIPRGGERLIRAVAENARVPVIKHYKGVCHVYVDATADFAQALDIVENAKCSRPGVCNAAEKVLVHADAAPAFLPLLAQRLSARSVELRGDPASRAIVPSMLPATPEDWDAEYLSLVLTVGVVPSLDAAIDHINAHSSHHSDAILSTDPDAIERFTSEVDSACVYSNASTRFTDGGEFGMGAEIGISTDKLHARGPMGLEELTSYKYVVTGSGQIRP